MAVSLLRTRRFAPLFFCQLLAAFGENFLLNATALLILFELGGSNGAALVPLATAALIAPSFVLSALGGELADRFDMALIARRVRVAGVAIAGTAALGFVLGSLFILFGALLAFGIVVALFTPIKFGILPRLLASSELPAANAWIEGSTIIGVLFATVVAGLTVRYGGPALLAALTIGCSAASWGASLLIPPTGEAAPGLAVRRDVVASTRDVLKELRGDQRIAWGALMTCWFWAVGVVVTTLLPPLVKSALGGDEIAVTIYLAIFALGVAVGCAGVAWFLAGRTLVSPTLVAALLLGVFAVDLGWASGEPSSPVATRAAVDIFAALQGIHVALALVGLAVAGGAFIVPVMAALQAWAGADRRARVMAGVNVLTAAAMTTAALVTSALLTLGIEPPTLFILLGVASVVVALLIRATIPGQSVWQLRRPG